MTPRFEALSYVWDHRDEARALSRAANQSFDVRE